MVPPNLGRRLARVGLPRSSTTTNAPGSTHRRRPPRPTHSGCCASSLDRRRTAASPAMASSDLSPARRELCAGRCLGSPIPAYAPEELRGVHLASSRMSRRARRVTHGRQNSERQWPAPPGNVTGNARNDGVGGSSPPVGFRGFAGHSHGRSAKVTSRSPRMRSMAGPSPWRAARMAASALVRLAAS
jgi:hypothetical protein